MPNSPRRFVRKRIAAERLASLWLVFFLIGTLVIFLRPAESTANLTGMLIPCGILLLFCLLGIREKNKNTAKFADSLYFMGFLWTLAALIDTVVAEEVTVNTAFQSFGYALTATGLGMLLRVVVLQYQPTIPDQLEETQKSLEESLGDLLKALGTATQAAEGVGKDVAARTKPKIAELESVLTGLHTTFETVMKAILEKSATTVDAELQRAKATLQSNLTPIAESVSAIATLPDTVTKLRSALEQLNKILDEGAVHVSKAATERINDSAGNLKRSEQAVRAAGDAATKLSTAVDKIVSFLKQDLGNA